MCTASCAQKRTISFFGWGKNKSEGAFNAPKNPLTEEYLKRKPQNQPKLVRGDLAPSSILEDEEAAGAKPADKTIEAPERRNPANMRAVLDPDPASRRRWQRKMVIKDIVKRGRMSKAQIVKRTEREFHLKSHNFPTSVKKLGPLARQITGKSIDDAITQMRFSKKLAAVNVRNTLVQAKNEAIVSRGMGLGTEETATQVIMTNDKKRVKVKNPTNMYVAQAWVGKGPYGRSPDYRARGQMFMMKNPTTRESDSYNLTIQADIVQISLCCSRKRRREFESITSD